MVMNAKTREGTSVHQHVLKMIMHNNDADVNGLVIKEANHAGMILETFSPSFL